MHIVVNTLSITPDRGGVKTYLTNLVRSLVRIDKGTHVTLLCSQVNKSVFEHLCRREHNIQMRLLGLRSKQPVIRVWYDQVVVPMYCRQYEDAVLLSQASASSVFTPLPEVVVIQVPLSIRSIRSRIPSSADTTTWPHRLYYDTMLPLTIRRADLVVTVSDYLRQEIVDLYPQFEQKVRSVKEGVNLSSFRVEPRDGTPAPAPPYLLFVSTLFPYKRADQALRAFARVHEQRIGSIRLKLAGKDPGGEQRRLEQLARRLGVREQVEFLGAVPHDQMPALYQGASALLFPSTVETFGLPVLEAMASGTPVIASNRMSVPEVVGDAGLIVDPDDPEAIARAVCRVLDDEILRHELREAGKQRAQTFTWERTARGVWRALKDAKEGNA